MRVLHLSTSDTNGGAARAAYRLHTGLRSNGVDSQMLVQNKCSDEEHVYGPEGVVGKIKSKIRPRIDKLPLKRHPDRDSEIFSPAWTPERRAKQIAKYDPDIVHLHWISGGFMRPETIAQIDAPVVWTLHDMWAMTGGCHYSGDCNRYRDRCGSCPKLGSSMEADLSRLTWIRKKRAWEDVDLTIVTPSRWLAQCAHSSTLLGHFPIEVIPYGIDLDVYKPVSRTEARRILNLPPEPSLILFGAMNPTQNQRKGFDLLLEALNDLEMRESPLEPELVVFGNSSTSQELTSAFRAHYLGQFSDDEALALLYSAADVFVAPSRRDNLPLSVQESLACGTPVVAFDIGGMPDMISHRSNGYLADPYDSEDLATGIAWCLREDRREELSEAARTTACDKFSLERNAEAYVDLYRRIANRK